MPINDIPASEYEALVKSQGVTYEYAEFAIAQFIASLRKTFAERGQEAPKSDYELLKIAREAMK
jgi:hypothetical protein